MKHAVSLGQCVRVWIGVSGNNTPSHKHVDMTEEKLPNLFLRVVYAGQTSKQAQTERLEKFLST